MQLSTRRFVVIGRDEVPAFAAAAEMQPWVAGAGSLIVGWSTLAESPGATADVFISLTQMETAAVALGYGTCWLGIWDRDAVTRLIRGQQGGKVVSILAGGPAAGEGAPKAKLPLSKLVGRGRLLAE